MLIGVVRESRASSARLIFLPAHPDRSRNTDVPEESLIAIDVGNTNVHIGLFVGETLEARWSLKADTGRERDDYGVALTVLFDRAGVASTSISKAVIGSVVPPLTPLFESVLCEYCSVAPLVVRAGTRTGVRLVYDPVFELGADCIAHAVAAEKLYGTPAIVVDSVRRQHLMLSEVAEPTSAGPSHLGFRSLPTHCGSEPPSSIGSTSRFRLEPWVETRWRRCNRACFLVTWA